MRLALLASLLLAVAPGAVHAGPFCDQFREATAEKQGTYLLFMVDEMLKDWPLHHQFKGIMSDTERLTMFSDARRKVLSECSSGKDFAAGVAFGEDLAVYKVTLLRVAEDAESVFQE